MFLTVSLGKSKGQSLKYATSMQTGCKDLRKFQFEAIVQLLKKKYGYLQRQFILILTLCWTKGTESFPKTLIFQSLYLCKPMS